MTPTIWRLAAAAEALGKYITEAEYILVRDEFSLERTPDRASFKEWVTGYQYYNAVVCICGGQIEDINAELEADFAGLVAMVRGDAPE